jgi:putative transposase
MHLRIGGRTYDLRRAVDAEGIVLEVILHARRNQEAAGTLPRRLVERQPTKPRVPATDKLTG